MNQKSARRTSSPNTSNEPQFTFRCFITRGLALLKTHSIAFASQIVLVLTILIVVEGAAARTVALSTDSFEELAKDKSPITSNSNNEIEGETPAIERIEPVDFTQLPDAQKVDSWTGPAVGAKVPDFSLPDQNGKIRRLHDLMGKSGILLIFIRSADW